MYQDIGYTLALPVGAFGQIDQCHSVVAEVEVESAIDFRVGTNSDG